MLYLLTEFSDGGDVFNLFRYITFRAGAAAIQMDGGDEGPHERGALGPAAGVEGPGKECFKSHRGLRGRDGSRPVGHGPAPSWAKPFRFETAFFQRRSTPKNGG